MLGWDIIACSFNALASCALVSISCENARVNQQHLPFYALRTLDDSVFEAFESLLMLFHPRVDLCQFHIDLPTEFLADIMLHVVDNQIKLIEFLQPCLVINFFIQPQVLEPERTIRQVKIQPLFAVLKRLQQMHLFLFILGRLQEHMTVLFSLFNQKLKKLASLGVIATSTFEESAFKENLPGVINRRLGVIFGLVNDVPDVLQVMVFLFNFD